MESKPNRLRIESRSSLQTQELESERGSCMMEFAIVVPILVFTLFSGIETFRALGAYLRMSQIAYEGARLAASYPGLEQGSYSGDAPPNQFDLRRKIFDVIQAYSLDTNQIILTTEHTRTAIDGTPENHVTILLQGTYEPLFGMGFPELPISVSSTSPYLFPDS